MQPDKAFYEIVCVCVCRHANGVENFPEVLAHALIVFWERQKL